MQQSFRLSACHEEPERRAFAHSALDTEAEAVLLENGLGDGQAEAGALPARVGAGAVIPVKDIGQVICRDAGTVVFHLDPDRKSVV